MKGIFITVRSGSTRLPNKAHLIIKNKKTIEYVIDTAKKSKLADVIVLCTTNLPEDYSLCKIAADNDIQFFQGSVNDKLERWNSAASCFGIDFFITADGDDLFCSHELFDLAFMQYSTNKSDFIQASQIVPGAFTYGISAKALRKACEIKDTDNTEMMWVYFTETNICSIEELQNIPNIYFRNDIRMTLDYNEDLLFFKKVINNLGCDFDTREVLSYLDKNKDIIDINYFLEDEWKQNQMKKTTLEIK